MSKQSWTIYAISTLVWVVIIGLCWEFDSWYERTLLLLGALELGYRAKEMFVWQKHRIPPFISRFLQ